MSPQNVPTAEPAKVVVSGFTSRELDEMRRGLVQRMTVAKSNIIDKRNTDDAPDWRDMYETCWSAYSKISKALSDSAKPLEHDDEFAFLSKPVGED